MYLETSPAVFPSGLTAGWKLPKDEKDWFDVGYYMAESGLVLSGENIGEEREYRQWYMSWDGDYGWVYLMWFVQRNDWWAMSNWEPEPVLPSVKGGREWHEI